MRLWGVDPLHRLRRSPSPAEAGEDMPARYSAALAQLGVSSTALVGNDTGAWTCYLAMG